MVKKTLFLIILFFLILIKTTNIFYLENSNIKNGDKIIENYIEIPTINLKKEFYIDTINVKKQKEIIMYFEYGRPNIKNSNTIIGAHSGNSKNSFFKNLYKLKKEDDIKINYENKIYNFKIYDIFHVDQKDLSVLKSKNKNILTLITCKNYDRSKRLIVVAELK